MTEKWTTLFTRVFFSRVTLFFFSFFGAQVFFVITRVGFFFTFFLKKKNPVFVNNRAGFLPLD